MNAPHWHLAINHLPVVGVLLVALLLGYALVRDRGELFGVCLGALVLLALATVPVYFTGRSADDALMEFADVDESLVHLHEAAATVALAGIGVLGVVALAAMWMGRKQRRFSRGIAGAVFVLALVETGLLGRAANLGGDIRHPEIRTGTPAPKAPPPKSGQE